MTEPADDSLARLLARRILLDGPISLSAFMAEALGHPRHGYYMRQDPFGVSGDFITAPEISQMFGEMVGLWLVDSWMRLGGPTPFNLVELGPGRGTLMRDALRAAAVVPLFMQGVQVHMVEMSPTLRDRQRATLADLPDLAVSWTASLDQVPEGPTLVIANEFFDALPIRQIERAPHGWCERLVDIDPDTDLSNPRFRFVLEAFGSAGASLVPTSLKNAPVGSVVEISPVSAAVARVIGERLANAPGAAIVIDYGYEGPAVGDTLQALRQHNFAPALEQPGQVDVTAHVDFTSIANAARDGGAVASAVLAQGEWLGRIGIVARAMSLKRTASPAQAKDIDTALARLIAPDQMGTLFKVMALVSPDSPLSAAPGPAGFVTG